MYYTQHKVEAIFSRKNKQFFFVPWDAFHDDINTEDVSNHTIRQMAEDYGKILDIEEIDDIYNTGRLSANDYYLRVF